MDQEWCKILNFYEDELSSLFDQMVCYYFRVPILFLMVGRISRLSKHLKGRLGPRVGDVTFFWIKGGQLDPPFGDSRFLDQRRLVGSPCR